MKHNIQILIKLLIIQYLSVLCLSQDFDLSYLVQRWPGSFCARKLGCCYPTTGKPKADFVIHGLWPNKNGTYPNCTSDIVFDISQISDLTPSLLENWPTFVCPSNDSSTFWEHEWDTHGKCSASVLDLHSYFEVSLKLKEKFNFLQILNNAGVKPDDKFYELRVIEEAIIEATGFKPGIQCLRDVSDNSMLYQIYMCVDKSATRFIECPVVPTTRCDYQVKFPKF